MGTLGRELSERDDRMHLIIRDSKFRYIEFSLRCYSFFFFKSTIFICCFVSLLPRWCYFSLPLSISLSPSLSLYLSLFLSLSFSFVFFPVKHEFFHDSHQERKWNDDIFGRTRWRIDLFRNSRRYGFAWGEKRKSQRKRNGEGASKYAPPSTSLGTLFMFYIILYIYIYYIYKYVYKHF